MSDAFDRFKFSFFEDENSARDGLDTAALEELAGDERSRAEAMLIDYLPDTRAVIGLGVLRSRRAEGVLARLFEEQYRNPADPGLVDLATALWRIQPDQRWRDAMTSVLASAEDEMQRMHAAIALAGFADPAAVAALTAALDDPDSLVRHHAARALLALHGVEADVVTSDNEHMMYRVMADDAARRAGGKRDVLAAIAGRALT
jgi:hypothetical protein